MSRDHTDEYDRPYHYENIYDGGNMPSRIVKTMHSRWLTPRGQPFRTMPGWVNVIRQRAKRLPSEGFSITVAEVRRLAEEYPTQFSRHVVDGDVIWIRWISDWPGAA